MKLIIVSLLIVMTSANDVSEGLQEYIQEILDNIGPALRVGIPEANVPPLDPYIPQGQTNFNQDKGSAKVQGHVKDIKIEGLSNMKSQITHMDVQGLNVKAKCTISISQIKITGTYNLDGKAFSVIPIRGNGGLLLETNGVRGHLDLSLYVNPLAEILEARDVKAELNFDTVEAHFENLINEKLSQIINKIINFLAKPLFDRVIKEKLDHRFSEQLKLIINKRLKVVKFDKIKNLIG